MKFKCSFNIPRLTILIPVVLYLALCVLNYKFSFPLKSKERHESTTTGITLEEKVVKDLPPIQLLSTIFERVDKNGDKLVSVEELSTYIQQRTHEHINQAMHENYGLFMTIDKNPKNGVISWEEYHEYFLQKHGVDDEYIKKHTEKHRGLGRLLKEMIARDMASWVETAHSDPDFLTLDEFLAFRHPESSHSNMVTLADDLLDKLDRDGDELLTEDEFARLQIAEGEVSQGEAERRQQFRAFLDVDSNGTADKQEILKYLDPKNPRHAKEEAETLVTLSDSDRDGKLSLAEVLAKMDLFLGSKMVDTASSFHDEF